MSLPISQRVQRVKPSPTVALTGRVAQLKAEGKDIISLGAGEPDFDTPQHIADAGVEAIRKGFTRYTPISRMPSSPSSSAKTVSSTSAAKSWYRAAPSRPSSI
jgi:aspartate aminotransferase